MQYTVVITSAGRHNLLKQTWEMFSNTCGIQPRQIIVVEDGPGERPDWFPRHNVQWLTNGVRRGQIYSVDRAYERVQTPYIFHLEDDWGFYETGYIEQSLEILEKYDDILQVWLRGIPTYADLQNRFTIYTVKPHAKHDGLWTAQYHWENWRGGFSFNPGLRRLADWKRIGGYGRHVGYDPKGCGERALGCLYDDRGFGSAILPKPFIYHIGDESHVDRKANPDPPRILIAVPTADELDYSRFRPLQKQKYGKTWEGGVSGLQHDGPNTRRPACEATWVKDAANFPNLDVKFFTGAELGCGDDFVAMPAKIKALCQWALDHGYERVFRCDDDTFVYVDRLMRQAYEHEVDYGGYDCGGFAIGGSGIWLSRRALEIIANSTWAENEWRDDAFIGDALKAHGIKMADLPGLSEEYQTHAGRVTVHPVSPERMKELYGLP
jgi:hypothetical protein